VELVVPGSAIRSTWLGGQYKLSSGMSMVTPFVTGAIALLLGRFCAARQKILGKKKVWTTRFCVRPAQPAFPCRAAKTSPAEEKPALVVVVVVAVDRSSYNIISGVGFRIMLSFFTSARLQGRRRCTLSDGSRRWRTWCPDVILLSCNGAATGRPILPARA
jgi:hypothetical protein